MNFFAFSQDNSPYSRYGMGDLVNTQNIVNKGMGGIGAAYSDYGIVGAPFSINLLNPASLGNLSHTKNFSNTIFDIGSEVDIRTLKSTTNTNKFKSTNPTISYLQVGFPLSTPKMERKGTCWGMAFGLKPVTKINYKIDQSSRITNIDSAYTIYEGNGGINQVNISTGIKKIGKGKSKNEFSIGISSGYTFGNKDYSSRLSLINDTVSYYKSNADVNSKFGGVFLNAGFQYEIHLNKAGTLRLGGYANFQQKLKAKQNTINETYGYDASGGIYVIDSVAYTNDVPGTLVLPLTYGGGFTFQSNNKHWLFGADYECSNWSQYSFYNSTENVQDIWTIKTGIEYYPAKANTPVTNYWNYLKYRTGFYYGPDYIKLASTRNMYAFTAGASLPLTTPRYVQSRGEYVALNTSFEIGARGNKSSQSFRENFTRFNIGISMNARWFQKRSYE